MQSRKFAKTLEIILLVGNIMNTGSRNAQSIGFEITYLTQVRFPFLHLLPKIGDSYESHPRQILLKK